VTTATVCFKRKSSICIAKFGNLGANGVKGSKFQQGVWENQELPFLFWDPLISPKLIDSRKLKFGTLVGICRYYGYM